MTKFIYSSESSKTMDAIIALSCAFQFDSIEAFYADNTSVKANDKVEKSYRKIYSYLHKCCGGLKILFIDTPGGCSVFSALLAPIMNVPALTYDYILRFISRTPDHVVFSTALTLLLGDTSDPAEYLSKSVDDKTLLGMYEKAKLNSTVIHQLKWMHKNTMNLNGMLCAFLAKYFSFFDDEFKRIEFIQERERVKIMAAIEENGISFVSKSAQYKALHDLLKTVDEVFVFISLFSLSAIRCYAVDKMVTIGIGYQYEYFYESKMLNKGALARIGRIFERLENAKVLISVEKHPLTIPEIANACNLQEYEVRRSIRELKKNLFICDYSDDRYAINQGKFMSVAELLLTYVSNGSYLDEDPDYGCEEDSDNLED